MINIYTDESGSLCPQPKYNCERFFFVGLVKVNNTERAKRRMKKFISRNLEKLKEIDEKHIEIEISKGNIKPSSMFVNDKFNEIKGSVLTKEMKFKFLDHMCVDGLVEIFLIKVDNTQQKPHFLDNTARAFNYILKLALTNFNRHGLLNGELYLHLDNRNVKTNTVYLLKEYLNTELVTGECIYKNIHAEYYQSECCPLIQIADVVANVHYSSQFNRDYRAKMQSLEDTGYIKSNFTFPKSSIAYKNKNCKKEEIMNIDTI